MTRHARFVAVLLLLPACAGATPWHDFGPRAMGMGGAQVAVAQGPLAAYWNPAGLAQKDDVKGFVAGAGVRGEFAGSVLQGANDLHQLVTDCQSGASTCTQANINAALARLGATGSGALVDVGGGGSLNFKRLVFFVNDLAYIGATPQVDNVNTAPGVGAGSVANNNSQIVLRGANFTEFGVGYARPLGETGLMLGGNLKGISGKVGYNAISISGNHVGGGSFSQFKNSAVSSFQPGIDLGALWDVRRTFSNAWWRPRVGLVARDINNPKFTQPAPAVAAGDRGKFSLHGQLRGGVALSPLNWWHLAGDLDLTRNVTNVDGFKSQYLSAGTEIDVFNREWINIPLRFGLQKNVANVASGPSWTGGFGLHLIHVTLDFAGMVSSRRAVLQAQGKNQKVPNNFGGSVQLGIQFGGHHDNDRS